ncbi:hypothetical protein CKO15_05185 [Halorhodospira abdelmalekii]|uniref:DUF4870 family protein n=1 Tax=Halorhodospira abdelmalekii TaxID=421629 RepID=UPI0019039A16|nr:hypothetical protein [Halorhodospira abdelmalekii]MBK1734690.1 hypothetical protein [Halorhodospira abdelmalekii]
MASEKESSGTQKTVSPGVGSSERAAVSVDKTLPMVAYILYLAGPVTGGLSALVGVVIAYVNRSVGGEFIASHYTNMITTFWISLVVLLVFLVTAMIGIGFLIYVAWLIWVIVRCVIGLSLLNRNEPMPDPQSWWLGR